VVADVEVTREGPVLTITLNRPDVLNALNRSVHAGLAAGLERAQDPTIRAVVITGVGRGFCVGQDLQEFSAGAGDVADNLRRNYHRNVLAIRALEKPVIAAVNGPAAGAGLSLALACDIRIAADSASFVPAFINIGLVPDSGGTWLVRRLLGTTRAFEWLTTGRRLPAEEAREWGVVNEVVPADELMHRANEVASLYAAMPTRAVWRTKQLLDEAEHASFADQLEREAVTQSELTQTHDFREGVAAFLEKREPAFTGADVERPHPITLVNGDDRNRWRLTVLLRWVLAIPHLFLVYVWTLLAMLVAIVNWFIALVRGQTPPSLRAWFERYLRYSVHVTAYTYLLADPYPKFRGWPGTYPVDLRIDPPAPQRRWTILLRLVLAVPALIFSYVLNTVVSVVAFLAWFAALATGRIPSGLQRLGAYCLRFHAQTLGYLLLVTDRYPTLANEYVSTTTPASSSATAGRT
jgi:2-(1,2-epoxy-1,2-dihydrophenyl)acetyl-CoA isomerase